ncbi:MAG TPA: hypothetical protein VL651_14795, partial [Bacteroidia bacterium]|nr:hypothetical protein [Bacteroidia bacterium]
MKKVFLAFSVITLFILSCGPKLNTPLIGTWKLDDIKAAQIEVTPTDSGALGGAVDSLAQGMATVANAFSGLATGMASAFLKGTTYEFKSNGTLSHSLILGSEDGKFSVTPDNKSVTMTLDGKDEVYAVKQVDDKQLILTDKDNMDWV